MIIDASALLAVVLDEVDGRQYAHAIAGAARRRMPAVTWFEASLYVETRGDQIARQRFDDIFESFDIELLDFTAEHARLARTARRQYGAGENPARLNFGDCMAYAVAKHEREPLLFKGNDFAQTDIEPALKD